jgi:UDP-N-acetylmuramoylalanine--D-glutamate ligase
MSDRTGGISADSKVTVLGNALSGTAAARLARARGARVFVSEVGEGPEQLAAAEELRAEGMEVETGGHDIDRILNSDLVVVSPGINPATEVRRALRRAGVRAIAEIELAFRELRSRVIGITGTNGKTTTSAMTGHLLETAGVSSVTAGNIGRPLSDVALMDEQPDWVVVEVSSFQLADIDTFAPDIGLILNLSPDHLDRYRNLDSYYEDKRRLFANASDDSRWVINGDEPTVVELANGVAGQRYVYSTAGEVMPGAYRDTKGMLRLALPDRKAKWLRETELQLVGSHNVSNALAAALAAALAGCDDKKIAEGLASFEPLPHRLQPVADFEEVLWVNDSKSTNVSAAAVAIESFEQPVILLLGGRHKGESYTKLLPRIESRVRAVIAFGEAAPQIISEMQDKVPDLQVAGGLESAVRLAADLASPGDVVLLSPACSSYDMFPNYEARGRAFEANVRQLHAVAQG